MPIRTQSDLPAKEILEQENIFVMDESRAMAAMAFPALCRPGTASLISQMASLLCMAVKEGQALSSYVRLSA